MEKEIISNEKRWYYEVPERYVFFDKKEKALFGEDLLRCGEIDFARPPRIPKIWKLGQPIDVFSSASFLQKFFWELKQGEEKIQIKVPEEMDFHKSISLTDIKTKEKLFEIMEYLSIYGQESSVLYIENEKIKRAVVLQPAEGMRIYLNKEEIPAMKSYLSDFGEETEYSLYQQDELKY